MDPQGRVGQRTDTFGDVINEPLELAILILKEQMHGMEVRTHDIPTLTLRVLV